MQIIPALYLSEGKLARFIPAKLDEISYIEKDPYEVIELLDNTDVGRIHIIDLDASIPTKEHNHGLLGSLCNVAVSPLEVGGGIVDRDFLKSLQYAGVDYFVLGSVVFDDFEFVKSLVAEEHVKTDHVIISLDVKDGELARYNHLEEEPPLTLKEIIWKCMNTGFSRFIITDLDPEDETGPNADFYAELIQEFEGASFSASGRINNFDDAKKLEAVGVREVIVGNHMYTKEGLLDEIKVFNQERKA